VKLKASAPSIHMMKADIQTEVSPMVGTESQSEELVKFLLKEFESDPGAIWNTNMFGKSLHELVSEGLNGKLAHMPKEAREKITGTIGRIINEGSGGLICILL
jgi:stage IV sporulation protein A